jgi:hypothetical protein
MSIRHLAAIAALAAAPLASHAAVDVFASNTHTFIRGSVVGDFPGWYGGNLLGAFPVAMTEAEARAAVIGANDNIFVSLPGVGGTTSGQPFPGAYVEVSFGADFGPYTQLKIWELGDNQESAHLFLWTNNGGNIQVQYTRGANDLEVIDLSGYAGTLALMGATSFTKVGIGGLDINGASKGFDLDAVAITAVPEPETYALMLAGLGLVGWMARRQRRQA